MSPNRMNLVESVTGPEEMGGPPQDGEMPVEMQAMEMLQQILVTVQELSAKVDALTGGGEPAPQGPPPEGPIPV